MRLWAREFGYDQPVNAMNAEEYLAGIPRIPAGLLDEDSDLPFLSLADPRYGLFLTSRYLGVQFSGREANTSPFDPRFDLPTQPFWFRHDDGRHYRGRSPDECRAETIQGIRAGTAMEGAFAYFHFPEIFREPDYVIDLPGTVRSDERLNCASMKIADGRMILELRRISAFAHKRFGTLRVRLS
ncbi:hypothetical protein HY733_00395 [Candidatus Uhrbacteria bacterium]|nr:hypothetical protein [Candidatus Uhrbacteria bacterium]